MIGSGATAVTLVPALAETAAHVTMLQRSPTYVISVPGQDPVANFLNRRLPSRLAYKLIRWKNVLVTSAFYRLSRKRPNLVRRLLRSATRKQLPSDHDVDVHFKPQVRPLGPARLRRPRRGPVPLPAPGLGLDRHRRRSSASTRPASGSNRASTSTPT